MGFLDKVKAEADKALKQGQDKLDEVQSKKKADGLLRSSARGTTRSTTGRDDGNGPAEIARITAELAGARGGERPARRYRRRHAGPAGSHAAATGTPCAAGPGLGAATTAARGAPAARRGPTASAGFGAAAATGHRPASAARHHPAAPAAVERRGTAPGSTRASRLMADHRRRVRRGRTHGRHGVPRPSPTTPTCELVAAVDPGAAGTPIRIGRGRRPAPARWPARPSTSSQAAAGDGRLHPPRRGPPEPGVVRGQRRPRGRRHHRLLRRRPRRVPASFTTSNCLIAPNFAIGAILMMRFAELAAPWFETAEIIELHHDAKIDAPSGTAMRTRRAHGRAPATTGPTTPRPTEVVAGARGGDGPGGIRVHSVRLRGLVAHQEVLLGTTGQTLTIRHDTYDRSRFMPGVLLAVKHIADHPGVVVGLDEYLEMG